MRKERKHFTPEEKVATLRRHLVKQKRIEFLEKKVQTKDEVLAELMAEHIALKKSLGVAAMLAGSLAGESPAGGSLPSYPRSDIRRRRG